MDMIVAVLAGVSLAWYLAYRGVSLSIWLVATVGWLLGGFLGGALGGLTVSLLGIVLLLPLAILAVPPVRRRLLTGPLFGPLSSTLPAMTDTEREALEAGDTWWETELFRGRPDWHRLHDITITALSADEQAFLDNQVVTLCRMLDEDEIVRERRDLPPRVWDYLRRERFFSLIIPREYGGLDFGSLAQSTIVTRIATRSISTAVTVMVPNSLGPGELLMRYGTDEQKRHWLPRLASGQEIPCFALTGPDVGSDAGGMPDYGIVCRGEHDGREQLGIRLSFSKRYITLAPVATVVGLAFRLHDPDHLLGDQEEIGITCALIPADHPGMHIGERHFPMGLAFMNGPLHGEDVFIPLDWIIGGREMAGRGWRMLVECLSVGRAISLPALATAAGLVSYRMTGAYARIRRQFKLPIGRFEGVQEALARIGGLTYQLEAARVLTASAGDSGVRPAVVSAIAKYHMTEMMRQIVNDAMDIHGGRGIILGPRNYLGYGYQAVPIGITVEGANILTRNLMIYGQGAIRCHPYVLAEMEAIRRDDLRAFDDLFWRHAAYTVNRAVRAFTLGLWGGRLATAPDVGRVARHYRALTRWSAALAVTSDAAMALLGGDLKRRERLSARLGDVLSHLYLASACLKYHRDGAAASREEDIYLDWAMDHALSRIESAFDAFLANLPNRPVAMLLRMIVFPLGRHHRGPPDSRDAALAAAMMEQGGVRDRLTAAGYWGAGSDGDVTGRMEHAFAALLQVEPAYNTLQRAISDGRVHGLTFETRLRHAVEQNIIGEDTAASLRAYEALRMDAIVTDAFPRQALEPVVGQSRRDTGGRADAAPAKTGGIA